MLINFLQRCLLFSVILLPIYLCSDDDRANFTGSDECQQYLSNIVADHFISLSQENEVAYRIVPEESEIHVQWKINATGQPDPDLFLLANDELISNSSTKYAYNVSLEGISLIIKNASEKDAKLKFDLVAVNCFENKTMRLSYNVTHVLNTEMEVVFLNSTVSRMKCEAISVLKPEIAWFFNRCHAGYCFNIRATEVKSERRNLQLLSYYDILPEMEGYLHCSASNSLVMNDTLQEIGDVADGINIFGSEQIKVIDSKTKQLHIKGNENVTLTCGSSVYNHTTRVSWARHKLDNEINDSSIVSKYTVFSTRQELKLPNEESDRYFCKSWTKNGTLEYKQIDVIYEDMTRISETYFIVPVLLILAILVIAAIVAVKMRKRRRLRAELKNFEIGALELLNPNLSIDDQANLLPYDKDYEFPIEKLTLGTQLGAGAFGTVVKAKATGILEDEANTTVAVKMVNGSIGDAYIKALVSELKILIHLGRHINIVNLLGACTRNIHKKELLVIVEYCQFGNLRDYLLSHRQNFIDQINPETGQIDFAIGNDSSRNKSEISYARLSFSVENEGACQELADSSDSLNPKLSQNDDNTSIRTRDLLVWSFQVARGMEYLSTRKVLHGDLAARNILLAEGNVVKICDFGLARKMYESDNYQKIGDEALPVKWMAIEAITDKIFSIQSDIWSFGVVLWEFFTLAKTPYPYIEFGSNFCQSLIEGYRMEKPQFATHEIYEIMLHCWDNDPLKRPSFAHLTEKLGLFLEDSLRNHYIDMNGGYVTMNAQKLLKSGADYVSMIDSPDFEKYSIPHRYVNVLMSVDDEGRSFQVQDT